jgi:hypothetical protein
MIEKLNPPPNDMKIDVKVLMSVVENTLVEIYNSDYENVKNGFERITENAEDVDADFLLGIVDSEMELFNSERENLKREFNIYLDNL